MDLASRRCCEANENYDAIAAGIRRGVDVEIWFPVVDGPNVASLIDHHTRLTHHWDEAGRRAWTVQRHRHCAVTLRYLPKALCSLSAVILGRLRCDPEED